MHALGAYIDSLMTARGMTRPELVRASGLSRQHVHQLLDPTRDTLGRMPEPATIEGLTRAFPESREVSFITKAAEALGVPVDRLVVVQPASFDDLPDEVLLGILAQRLAARRSRDDRNMAAHGVAQVHRIEPLRLVPVNVD